MSTQDSGEPAMNLPRPKHFRIFMEGEVQVTNEQALRVFDLMESEGPNGELGVIDASLEDRLSLALSRIFGDACRQMEAQTGIRLLGSTGPCVRPRDEDGNYVSFPLPFYPGSGDQAV